MGITFKIFKLLVAAHKKTYFSSDIECVYVAVAEHGLILKECILKSFAAHLEISHGTQFEKHCNRIMTQQTSLSIT